MIRNVISEGVHQLQLAKVVDRQLYGGDNHGALSSRTHSPPESPKAFVFVYLAEAAEQALVLPPSVHLHPHLQNVRGIGYRRGDGSCRRRAQNVAPNPLAAVLVCQQSTFVGQLLQGVVGSKLDGAICRLP